MANHGTRVDFGDIGIGTFMYIANDTDTYMDGYDASIASLNSSVSTLGSGKLDVPTGTTGQYVRGNGSLATFPTIPSGTVTSVGMTSTDFALSGSPITTSGSMTANLTTTGVSADTYSGVTVDTKGRVTAATKRSFANTASRSLVTGTGATGFQVSSTRDAFVTYNTTSSSTATIGGASSITVVLEIAPTNSSTAGDWVEISRFSNGQTITLAVVLQSVQTGAGNLTGIVPAGYYAKLRTITTGTASATYNTGQEVLL